MKRAKTVKLPKNDDKILALSVDAQAVLAGQWGFGATFTLTMGNQKSCFSDRGLKAMTELIEAGIILDKKANDGYAESRTYSLSDLGASLEFRKSFDWVESHGDFAMTQAIKPEGNPNA